MAIRTVVHALQDASVFLGPAGKHEVESLADQQLIESLRIESGMDEPSFGDYLGPMNKENGPTAYIFKCLHCGQYQAYSDDDS